MCSVLGILFFCYILFAYHDIKTENKNKQHINDKYICYYNNKYIICI